MPRRLAFSSKILSFSITFPEFAPQSNGGGGFQIKLITGCAPCQVNKCSPELACPLNQLLLRQPFTVYIWASRLGFVNFNKTLG